MPALDTSSLEFSFYRSSYSFRSLLKYFANRPPLNSILHFSDPILCFSWHFITKTFQYIYVYFFLCYYTVSSLRSGTFCSLFYPRFLEQCLIIEDKYSKIFFKLILIVMDEPRRCPPVCRF